MNVSDVGQLQDTLDEAGVDYTLNDVPKSGFMESLLPMLIVVAVVFILFMMMMIERGRRSECQDDEFWEKPCDDDDAG